MIDLTTMSCCNAHTVLCVDDDLDFLKYLSEVLKPYFQTVYSAKNAFEAYDIVDSQQVDLVITDLYMPQMNGLEFVKKLRQKDYHPSIILLTACFEKNYLFDAIPLKLDAYLLKPITLEKLFDTIKRSINMLDGNSFQTYHLRGGCTFDFANNAVFKTASGEPVDLTKKELSLLKFLILNKQAVVTKSMIEDYIWEFKSVSDSAVKTLVKKLRDKIGTDAIVTNSNSGYSISILKDGSAS